MSSGDGTGRFRQAGWAGLRARIFHRYFLLRRAMTLGVRAMVHDRATNSIFLIRHTYVPGWHLPGGGVEIGETLGQALTRECGEEGNIIFSSAVLRSMHLNNGLTRRDHVAFYLIETFSQATPKLPDFEIAEAGFFPIDALPADTTPATHRRVAEVFGGDEVSEYW
jgi:ADP-ribose pyrophosphatase YjhB (NUDIX family)